MTQASGSEASISIWEETTYATRPGSPTMFKIKAATEGVTLKQNVEKLTSKAITDARGTPSTRGGNIMVSGALPFELPLLGIGKLLKHAIGTAATPVAVKLVALAATGLTNVIVRNADTATPAGAGVITHTGATLLWAANGETGGAAVDVSAGGEFTLQSSVASHAIHIIVTGAVVGASAAATVGAAAYKHVITRAALPVGFGAQVAHPDINQFEVFDGLRVESMSISVANSGIVTGSMNLTGATGDVVGATLGTPSSVAHVPFVHHEATLMDGGASAKTTAFSFDLANELDPANLVGDRNISALTEGMGSASGKITTLFEDASMINKVINETASSLRAFFGAADGTGSVEFKFPSVKYYGEAGVGIPTAKGLVVSNDWHADSSVGATDIVVTIINSEATI